MLVKLLISFFFVLEGRLDIRLKFFMEFVSLSVFFTWTQLPYFCIGPLFELACSCGSFTSAIVDPVGCWRWVHYGHCHRPALPLWGFGPRPCLIAARDYVRSPAQLVHGTAFGNMWNCSLCPVWHLPRLSEGSWSQLWLCTIVSLISHIALLARQSIVWV